MWDERYAARELVWSAGPNQLFADLVRDLKPGRALDVACGEGRNAIWLAGNGWEVDAIDFSSVGIDKASRIAEKQGVSVNWMVSDILVDPLPVGDYDLVSVVFFHTAGEERRRWLPALAERVAKGGYFLYIGHDPSNVESGVGGPQDTDVLPDTAEVSGYLRGFELLRSEVHERQVEADPGHGAARGKALDTLVLARKT